VDLLLFTERTLFPQTELTNWSLLSGSDVDYEAGFFVVMHVTYFPGYVDHVLEFWQILEVG
jgi:hypothetical protein